MVAFPSLSHVASGSVSFRPRVRFSADAYIVKRDSEPFSIVSQDSSSLSAVPPPMPPDIGTKQVVAKWPVSSTGLATSSASMAADSKVAN